MPSAACASPIDRATAWRLLLAARAAVDAGRALAFTVAEGRVSPGADGGDTVTLDAAAAAVALGAERLDPGARELADLLLPLALAPKAPGLVAAILGQTLDGYIATLSGDSRYINGGTGLAHLHRMRALSDAVVVGASTAALDLPRLTTRHVEGPNAVRVVIDPRGRLPRSSPLLLDGAAPTLVVRAGDPAALGEPRLGPRARAIHLPAGPDGRIPPASIVAALRERGLGRLLVEGGGDTVTGFVRAGSLDRLQLVVAPVLLGVGRPAVALPPVERLAGALRPECRRYLMGEDVLFDLRLGRGATPAHSPAGAASR